MKKFLSLIFALGLMAISAAAAEVGDYISPRYAPSVTETTDDAGFVHPGVTLVKADLDRTQAHVRAEDEPWKTAFLEFAECSKCSLSPRIHYGDDSDKYDYVNVTANDNGFIGRRCRIDADTCLAQTIMWYITGVDQYRTNALYIIRSWSKMESLGSMDDEQIHFGVAMYKFSAAAEILRYSSYTGTKVGETRANVWSESDTEAFTSFLNLTYDKYNRWWHFMNQHGINNMAFMASAVFRGDREAFAAAVERTTVNSLYDNPRNGSIISAVREVDENALTGKKLQAPVIELVEMGRDQGHAYGDIGALSICAMTAERQGAKVDPESGQLSENGVSVFDFAGHRLLYGANCISAYNLGNDVDYVPVRCGQTADWQIYGDINDENRGLLYPNIGIIYNYYKYERNWDMDGDDIKYVTQAYEAMLPEGESEDFLGFSTLLFSGEGALGTEYPKNQYEDTTSRKHIENRLRSVLEGDVKIGSDASAAYVSFGGSAAAAYALPDFFPESGSMILRVRTTAPAKIEVRSTRRTDPPLAVFEIPDTNGRWVTAIEKMAVPDRWHRQRMTFFTVETEGETDIDYMEFAADSPETDIEISYEEKTYTDENAAYMYSGGTYLAAISGSEDFSVQSTVRIRQIDNIIYLYPSETGWQNISFMVESDGNIRCVSKRIFVFKDIEDLIDVLTVNHTFGGLYTSGSLGRYNAAAEKLRAAASVSCLNKSFAAAAAELAAADAANFLANVPEEAAAEPVLHYNFNGSAGNLVADVSPYGNDGISNGAIFGSGEAAFADDSYITLPEGILASADEATIFVAFKSEIEKSNAWLWSIANSSESGYIFFSPSRPDSRAYAAVTAQSYGGETGVSASAVPVGASASAAAVIGGGEIRLYINGALAGRAACSLTPADLGSTAMNCIGKSPYPDDPYFEGSVSDFRIYNRALTEEEIKNISSQNADNAPVKLLSADISASSVSLKLSASPDTWVLSALYSSENELLAVSSDNLSPVLAGEGAFVKVFAWDKTALAPLGMLCLPLAY